MHDSNKVLLGQTPSSDKGSISSVVANPATFPAGTAVRMASDGTLSTDTSDGELHGVSLGAGKSDIGRTVVQRDGLKVPLRLTDFEVKATLQVQDMLYTAVPYGALGNNISIEYTDAEEKADGSATVEVAGPDEEGLYVITVDIEATATTTTTIKTAIDEHEVASTLVTVEIDEGKTGTAQTTASEDALEGGVDGFDYVVVGEAVHIDDLTGLANSDDDEDSTASNATYASDPIWGQAADGSLVRVALIDMPGGL